MNCYEWRKKISGNISVTLSYNESTEIYNTTGSGTITHAPLYSAWTHRELQCIGAPRLPTDAWILRGGDLCQGRAIIAGDLPQANTIKLTTTTIDGEIYDTEVGIYFKIISENYRVTENLLALNPYPNWENDPYSKAYRAQIDSLTYPELRVGIGTGSPGAPQPNEVEFFWLKDNESGVSEDGTLQASLQVQFNLT